MDTKERAAQVLDDLKGVARGAADTPEPSDEVRLQRAAEYFRQMPDADVAALVETYPAFHVVMVAMATHHAGRSAADLDAASSQFAADVSSDPHSRQAAAALWICLMLRTPSQRATRDEIERWVDCLLVMPWTEANALLKEHPALRRPVSEAAVRRMRRRIYDLSLPASARAEAAAILVQLGIDAGPKGAH